MQKNAFAELVKMPQRFVQPAAHLRRYHRGCDQLRVGMLQAGSGFRSVVFEDGHLGDARIEAQIVIPRLKHAYHLADLRRGLQRRVRRVVGCFNDHFVMAESADRPPRALDAPLRSRLGRKRRKFVVHHPQLPPSIPSFTRRISGGVCFSFPGQKGHVATCYGNSFSSFGRASSCGRCARSVAKITHSLVKRFCRSSGIYPLPYPAIRSRARRLAGGQPWYKVEIHSLMRNEKIPVGIIGATGIVGQRFVQMLEAHPWFQVAWLAASERSEGKTYAEAARWRLKSPMPADAARLQLSPAAPDGAPKVVFAALDASVAAQLEPGFAAAGHAVISNSSALRMRNDVPLVIPEVNPEHLKLLECQAWRRKGGGFVVTNPNCSAIGLVLALAPLHQQFGLQQVMVVTMQAVSGAGYPGVASLDILGNVIPYIANEEEKMEEEARKLLGSLAGSGIEPAPFAISAQCNRVAVEDGHTESVAVKLLRSAQPAEIAAAWQDFRGLPQRRRLPSAPPQPVIYTDAPDRPQPRFDCDLGAGMSAAVGRLRPCSILDWKFTVLSHNTIRGAAGAALLNAELLKSEGYLD
jgi:aspartate-semialdehyde dehydrogenase